MVVSKPLSKKIWIMFARQRTKCRQALAKQERAALVVLLKLAVGLRKARLIPLIFIMKK